MAGIRLHIGLLSEAWLNWCCRRDAAILSAATVKRQTGVVSCDLGGPILGTGNKAQSGVVCLLLSTSRPRSLWSLPTLHSPVISTAVAVCVCLPSCPGHAHCVRVGRATGIQAKRERKPNEILTRVQCAPQLQTTTLKTKLCALYSRFYGNCSLIISLVRSELYLVRLR